MLGQALDDVQLGAGVWMVRWLLRQAVDAVQLKVGPVGDLSCSCPGQLQHRGAPLSPSSALNGRRLGDIWHALKGVQKMRCWHMLQKGLTVMDPSTCLPVKIGRGFAGDGVKP